MPNTLFIGKVYLRFDELSSTNDHAAELLASEQFSHTKSKPAEGTVIRADSQSAGRGQFGSRWESAAGKNLTFSVILYPTWLDVAAQFQLSMAVALAVHDALASLLPASPAPCIKWPNDLYLGARKTGGILIQNSLSGTRIRSSIVGIGLNVNQTDFDPNLPNPASMASATGLTFDPEIVIDRLFECLEHRYLQLKTGHAASIKADYEALLYRRDEPSAFIDMATEQSFTGTIRGVTDAGQLRVETAQEERLFRVKEIRFG